jgi:small neutral amino acid transporter SnatA (MarC family)
MHPAHPVVTAVFVGITLYGVLAVAGCLLLVTRAERIRARLLNSASGGLAALIRMIGLVGVVVGAALVVIGVGNLVVQA